MHKHIKTAIVNRITKLAQQALLTLSIFLILMIKLALNTQQQQMCEKTLMALMKTIMFKFLMK